MDFAFAPGNDGQTGRCRVLFQRRANTTLITQRGMTTLRGFVRHLETSTSVARPIDNILLGAHANSEGHLFMPMYPQPRRLPGQPPEEWYPTSFEVLESTLLPANRATRSIEIADVTIGRTPGDPITHSLHFRGCNIGQARPFLVKFHEALGQKVNVTAPKHFHGITEVRALGSFEYMAYEFAIRQPRDLPTRTAVLDAFDAAGFSYINGDPVLRADWIRGVKPWIPARVNARQDNSEVANLGVTIGRHTTTTVPLQFRVDRYPFTWTVGFANAGLIPRGSAARQTEMENNMQAAANFQATHPYPMYERLGYTSFTDFIAGYRWSFAVSGSDLVCTGNRTVYTVVTTILDRTTGNLIFNFYPASGTTHTAITTGLVETDPLFFESV